MSSGTPIHISLGATLYSSTHLALMTVGGEITTSSRSWLLGSRKRMYIQLSELIVHLSISFSIFIRYREKITLAGILFFHSIAETRMHGTPLLNLSMFEELCGPQALRNVVLTTTMWDKENQPIALQREGELREDFWQPMLARGCQMARFHYTHQSAWAIIDGFDISARRPMQVQEEIVDQKKNLRETAAYHVLVQWWEKIWTKFRATIFGGVKKRRALGSSSRGSSTSTLQQVVSGKEKKSEKQSFPSSMGEGSLRSRFLRRR